MKTLLAILLSFVISEAPVLAIHGGYSIGGSLSVTGTYAGALIPISDTVITTGTGVSTAGFGTNALGLFTLSMPTAGLGTGTVSLFAGNQEMDGTIQAVQDANEAAGLVGVINVSGNVQTAAINDGIFGNITFTQVTGNAGGGITASVVQGGQNSPTGTNLTGTANLTVDISETGTDGTTSLVPTDLIEFTVDGFQQSTVANAAGVGG